VVGTWARRALLHVASLSVTFECLLWIPCCLKINPDTLRIVFVSGPFLSDVVEVIDIHWFLVLVPTPKL
jgi:hypothetical protein